MKILAIGNYNLDSYKSQTPGETGKWNNIEFTTHGNECDILVVFNKPINDIDVKCKKGGRWLFIQEPPYPKNEYLINYFKYFDFIVSGFNFSSPNHYCIPALLPWHIGINYDQLMGTKNTNLALKQNKVVWITSSSNMNPGHIPRLNFLEILLKSNISHEVFGRGIKPIDCKYNALFQAKYSIAIENYSGQDYWTEKIADSFLAWTIPFYYGCKNIDKYFPKGSFINIDIANPTKAIDHIKEVVTSSFFEENLNALTEARELILNKYNFFPYIEQNLIERIENRTIRTYIPADPSNLKSRIKSYFINKF